MKLESLHIYATGYGESDRLTGSIKFSNINGNVELTLRQEHMQQVLEAVGQGLVESAKEVARDLTADIVMALPTALPPPASPPADDDIPF
jgi:hypothetical protein